MLVQTASSPFQLPPGYRELLNNGLTASRLTSLNLASPENDWLRNYAVHVARHPDQGSKYEYLYYHLKLDQIKDDTALVKKLISMGNEMLMYHKQDQIIGHVAFNENPDLRTIYVFSVFLREEHQGQGMSWPLVIDTLEYARQRENIDFIKIGDGGDQTIQLRCDQISAQADHMDLEIRTTSEFRFTDKSPHTWRKTSGEELSTYLAKRANALVLASI